MLLLVLRLLERVDADRTFEALLGDVMEELSCGRSRLWAWQQIMALAGLTVVQRLRRTALRPTVLVMAPGVSLLSALTVGPTREILVSWAAFYFISGVMSLVFDLVSTSTDDWKMLSSGNRGGQM